jgi:prolyl-tRNA editing enzyme YbaK/EbsC (Cys-tRNA(Pro) deacylase)
MIPEKVLTILNAHGLHVLEFEEGSTPTAEKAAEQIGVAIGQIAKSMIMRGKDGIYRMFVVAGDKRISSSKVKQETGFKHSMCPPEETRRVTGFAPGGVCPFGLEGIEIFIDRSLEVYKTIYPAAGTDASGVPTTYRQLLEVTGGKISDVTI